MEDRLNLDLSPLVEKSSTLLPHSRSVSGVDLRQQRHRRPFGVRQGDRQRILHLDAEFLDERVAHTPIG